MEIRIIYLRFSPIMSQTVMYVQCRTFAEHFQKRYANCTECKTLHYFILIFGRQRRSRLSNKQLLSEYVFGLWFILCQDKKFLDGQKQGASQVNYLGSLGCGPQTITSLCLSKCRVMQGVQANTWAQIKPAKS